MTLKVVIIALSISTTLLADINESYTRLTCKTKRCERASQQYRLSNASSNASWCGYVAATNIANQANYSVSKVVGSWVVPNIQPSAVDTYCSLWVGIDGFGGPTVEQIGTEHNFFKGQQLHYAWFEMYPEPSHQIMGFPVEPGDQITASVIFIPLNGVLPANSDLFIMQITNNTKRLYSIIPVITQSKMQRSCAEWVVEAPSLSTTLPLSNFGFASMYNCSAVINNVLGPINNPAWANEIVTMATPEGVTKASASPLSSDGKGFSVVWKHN
jgi:hypothetical protein